MKIYLAIPYSGIEEESFKIANHVASMLMAEGHVVYSPISHNHPIAIAHGLPSGWGYWEKNDTEFIKWCDFIMIVNIDEENERGMALIDGSIGVQAEIKLAKQLKKNILTHIYVRTDTSTGARLE